MGISIQHARPPNPLVARDQVVGVQTGNTPRDHLRKKLGVNAAETRFKQIPQPLHHDAEQLAIAPARHQLIEQVLGPGPRIQAMRQQILS